ncbi:hypothetical protein MLD38_022230 [Melastoma candidum]|uniref:Uncharacterized protein n=1 Tax=Melastoma candidum TaxID=119954 RepID=A0ACB9QHX6_9MYRT|nr:hypothetical protein MLD38_022230 [Melastoma candidum]
MKMVEAAKADRSVWLTKCPVVVARSWQSRFPAEPHNPKTVAKVVLYLDFLLPPPPPPPTTLALSSTSGDLGSSPQRSACSSAVEGKVEHKFYMKPNSYSIEEYGRLCHERTNKPLIKDRQVQVIDNDRGAHETHAQHDWHDLIRFQG